MEVRDARAVLRVLQAAFPQYPNAQGLPEDSVELYLRMLSETNARGEHQRLMADAMEAAASWVRSEDHFPAVTELLDAIQRQARRRITASGQGQLPPAWAGLPPEDMPPGPPPPPGTLDEVGRLSNVERLRAILRAGVVKVAPEYQPPSRSPQ